MKEDLAIPTLARVNLGQFALLPGVHRNTARRLLRKPDFPVARRGSHGRSYLIDPKAALTWWQQCGEKRKAEREARTALVTEIRAKLAGQQKSRALALRIGTVCEVQPDGLPLEGLYDLITILEVYEHLHNPLEDTLHLCEHLRSGGLLWENFVIHDDAGGPDLEVARGERPQVFQYLRARFELVSGDDPYASDGGEPGVGKR